MEQVVILKDSDRAGPLQRGQRGLHRAPQRVVEGEQPGRLTRPKHEVGQAFGPIGEGADDEGLRRGHEKKYSGLTATSSDLGSTFTIQRPELMSGT